MSAEPLSRAQAFIDRCVPEAMRESRTPAFSLALVRGDACVYAAGFGTRDPAQHLPAGPDTLYGVGSCTKAFVATAVLRLVQEGRLALEDPASRYIPLRLGAGRPPITIHHLLTHGSGIPSLSTSTILLRKGLGLDTGIPMGSVEDFYRFVNGAESETAADPGRRFFYNNAGYRMLGHIVQLVGGRPFHEYVTEKILRPLGMERTTFLRSEYESDPDRMVPQWMKPDGSLVPTSFPYPDVGKIPEFSFLAAAGGLISPVRELARFVSANLTGNPSLGLRPENLERLHRLSLERPASLLGRIGYGYGWMVAEDFLGGPMVYHSGSIEVSTAFAAFLPGRDWGLALASNSAGMPHEVIAEGIFAALLGQDPEKVVPNLLVKARMKALTGDYELYRGLGRVRVLIRGGLLYLEQKDEFVDSCQPLIPEDDRLGKTRFYLLSEGLRQPVEFVAGPEGTDLYLERDRYHKTRRSS